MSKPYERIIYWIVIVTMPFFLGFSAIELMVNNAELYVSYEYAKPNFPRDLAQVNEIARQQLELEPFNQVERERLALVAVEYLQRHEPAEEVIYLLADQQLPNSDRPLYNNEELSHMIDVKHVTDGIARLTGLAGVLVLGGLAILLAGPETRPSAYGAMYRGGLATMLLLLLIGLFIVLAWSTFFVQFHELLFPPGTWTFAYSDSLIRLFPEKFWFDFGVLLSVVAFLLGLLVTGLGWILRRRFS